jgi:hypothetical protein
MIRQPQHGQERLDRALEAVEGMTLSAENDLEGLVVVISADFTWSHIDFGLMFVLKRVPTLTAVLRSQKWSHWSMFHPVAGLLI